MIFLFFVLEKLHVPTLLGIAEVGILKLAFMTEQSVSPLSLL